MAGADYTEIAGGVQILARHTRLGDVGFINRGPVVVPEEPALFDFLTELLVLTAKTGNLRVLVIQLPDESKIDDRLWAGHQFLSNDLVELDSTTLLLELCLSNGGLDKVVKRLRKHKLTFKSRSISE